VPDTLMIDPTTPWVCRYNVFSSEFNRCDAAQEPMPPPPAAAAAAAAEIDIDEAVGRAFEAQSLAVVDERHEEAFSPSQCDCPTCAQMNHAAGGWEQTMEDATDVGTPPLVHAVLRAIDATQHIAAQFEDDKQFLAADQEPTM
jgi:hypothetical protein